MIEVYLNSELWGSYRFPSTMFSIYAFTGLNKSNNSLLSPHGVLVPEGVQLRKNWAPHLKTLGGYLAGTAGTV